MLATFGVLGCAVALSAAEKADMVGLRVVEGVAKGRAQPAPTMVVAEEPRLRPLESRDTTLPSLCRVRYTPKCHMERVWEGVGE